MLRHLRAQRCCRHPASGISPNAREPQEKSDTDHKFQRKALEFKITSRACSDQ